MLEVQNQVELNIFHAVALPASVQPKIIEVCVTLVAVNKTGFGQVGSGLQVTLATHPGLFTEPSLKSKS
jgi:hypothetical protein